MTWTVRPETPQDRAAVRAVVAAAFPTPAEADLVEALRGDAAWVPGLSMVTEPQVAEPQVAGAPDGGPAEITGVAGYALATRCRVGGVDALALGPVAVAPEAQSRGCGGAVVRGVLDAAAARAAGGGERLVVVLGHPEYYPRFGFVRASTLGVSVAFEVPDEALMVMVLDGPGPVPSGPVAYPAPFGVPNP
ncbi:N-acetyltransferase [Actinomadura spongiicola]|uniref:N-acetyltransferase n=1 Tax=Actinomadura spongiicola TaxID=2303421 RepID=A0A372GES9_9ACTN|nr:N-acetyltransferase [Actinomadura spongiicola]RFS83881.1 N-acetyltransferase [Actinomadura spongiicola]